MHRNVIKTPWEVGIEFWPPLEDIGSHSPCIDVANTGFEGFGHLVLARLEVTRIAVAELVRPVDLERVAEEMPEDVAAISMLVEDKSLAETRPAWN